jgi:hypothetical protein
MVEDALAARVHRMPNRNRPSGPVQQGRISLASMAAVMVPQRSLAALQR